MLPLVHRCTKLSAMMVRLGAVIGRPTSPKFYHVTTRGNVIFSQVQILLVFRTLQYCATILYLYNVSQVIFATISTSARVLQTQLDGASPLCLRKSKLRPASGTFVSGMGVSSDEVSTPSRRGAWRERRRCAVHNRARGLASGHSGIVCSARQDVEFLLVVGSRMIGPRVETRGFCPEFQPIIGALTDGCSPRANSCACVEQHALALETVYTTHSHPNCRAPLSQIIARQLAHSQPFVRIRRSF